MVNQNTPAVPAVRDCLERMLSSEAFSRSHRARRLLRYLVEREQAGEADRLKGFALAVDVFGRDAEFDPSTDAVVRVQASRLRELIEQYYETEGADDPVRISIPRGTYVPTYCFAPARCEGAAASAERRQEHRPPLAEPAETTSPRAEAEVGSPRHRLPSRRDRPASEATVLWHVRLFWAAMGVVIAMLGFIAYEMAVSGASLPPDLLAGESSSMTASIAAPAQSNIDMLPVVHLSTTGDGDKWTAQAAATLRTALSRFDTITFNVRDGSQADAGPLSFLFIVSPGTQKETVSVELQTLKTGRVLYSRRLSSSAGSKVSLDEQIADVASAAASLYGVIYSFIQQEKLQSGLTECLLLSKHYYLEQKPPNHEAAYRCFEILANNDVASPLVYTKLAALHIDAKTDGYPYPAESTAEEAMSLAQRALRIGQASPHAHLAIGLVHLRMGNWTESIRWTRKAYELNTYDLCMAAAHAHSLIFGGDYENGTPIVRHTLEVASTRPAWWDFSLFVGEWMLGNTNRARHATKMMVGINQPHYLAARLIMAREDGDDDAAKALLDQLRTAFPDFAANPSAVFEARHYPAELIERWAGKLREAGLGGES